MKYLIVILLVCVLGAQVGAAINAALLSVKAEAKLCKGRVLL